MSEKTPRIPLGDRGELLLARLIHTWHRVRYAPVKEFVPEPMHLYALEPAAAPVTARVPRIIWAFWTGATMPALIRRCLANWRDMCPGFEIRLLDEQSVLQYLPAIPASLQSASAPKRSDWVRLELLRRHGGIWLDASTVLTASLDWVINEQARTQSDFVGYYLEGFTTDAACPVVENWFMAAPPGSRFIADLQQEFTERVIPGSNEAYIEQLRAEGVFEQVCQRIFSPEYLSMHLAAQYVMRKRGGYRLALARAEDGPYLYHAAGHWSRARLKVQLMMRPAAKTPPPLVKLRAPDRKRLELYMHSGLVRADSTLGRYLGTRWD